MQQGQNILNIINFHFEVGKNIRWGGGSIRKEKVRTGDIAMG